jgi:uncharacterized repeat protein (TIGR03803 family)
MQAQALKTMITRVCRETSALTTEYICSQNKVNKEIKTMLRSKRFAQFMSLGLMLLAAILLPSPAILAQTVTKLVTFNGNMGSNTVPNGDLVMDSAGNIYGTTQWGGMNSLGSIFKYSSATGQMSTLYSFTGGTDGQQPTTGLILDSSGNLYGTNFGDTQIYGNGGLVFKFNLSTNQLTPLATLNAFTSGYNIVGKLLMDSAGNLYGVAQNGGPGGNGTIFKYSPSTAKLTDPVSFSGTTGATMGQLPNGGLVIDSAGYIYGTTETGGTNNKGTVFAYGSISGQFTTLYNFTGGTDGANPAGGLANGPGAYDVFGTTIGGGTGKQGTFFNWTTSGLSTEWNFQSGNLGGNPVGSLFLDKNGAIYGTLKSYTATAPVIFGYRPGYEEIVGYFVLRGIRYPVLQYVQPEQTTINISWAAGSTGGGVNGGFVEDSNGNLYGTTPGYTGGSNGALFKISGLPF